MISVIICTYNRCNYIYGVLSRLAKNDLPKDRYEIILVDNNCTDNTGGEVARFRADFPKVNLKYCRETSQGLSHARNKGIREAMGNILVFLDDDAFPDSSYLSTIESTLKKHPEIDCFGGEIIPYFEEGQEPEWLCKWSLSWVSGLSMGDNLVRFRKKFPIGANMGMRSTVLKTCRGFNANLGRSKKNLMGGEEKDFFLRAKRNGYSIWYIPDIEVKHVIPASRTTMEYVQKLGRGIGESEKIRCKNEGSGSYVKRVISEMVKWIGTIILSLGYRLKGKAACAKALVLFRRNVSRGLL